ncbi:hypothetical protein F5I97DRAFT_1928446 [Phlebopus sp. FC_14]|nr:hypothetical protein F5I97DRAFT_1928446 [Phlebopus sp. FC_14]
MAHDLHPSQDLTWRSKEQGEEARYVREREQAQLAAIRDRQQTESRQRESEKYREVGGLNGDFEGGFGGQEDLEDRYATTSGEH